MSNFENKIFNLTDAAAALDEGRFCERVSHTYGIRGETCADFVLPDYMGDVKRLLKSSASVSLANKYTGSAEVSFLMMVSYRVTYIDSEEKLTEAVFDSDYEYNAKCQDGFVDAFLNTRVDGIHVRLQGPRKISARAALISDLSVTERCKISDICDFAQKEIKETAVNIHKAEFLSFPKCEHAVEIGRLEGVGSDEIEVIKSDAKLIVESCERHDDRIVISGGIHAFCLLRVNEDIIRLEKELPYESSIVCDGEQKSSGFLPSGGICSVGVHLNSEIGDGADAGVFYTAVVMDMTSESFASCNYNVEYPLISDAFECGAVNECGYRVFSYDELVASVFERRKVGFTIERDGTPIRSILDSDVRLSGYHYEICGSDIVVHGVAEYNIIVGGMTQGECAGIRGEREIEERIRLSDALRNQENVNSHICVMPCEVSVTFDGEKIYMNFTLSVLGFVSAEKSERILTSLVSTKKTTEGRRIIVYYPKCGEDLWGIAKKYSVPVSEVGRRAIRDEAADGAFSRVIIEER